MEMQELHLSPMNRIKFLYKINILKVKIIPSLNTVHAFNLEEMQKFIYSTSFSIASGSRIGDFPENLKRWLENSLTKRRFFQNKGLVRESINRE